MFDPNNNHFSLRVVTNKQKTKVLYAEADSQFADVLLSFLTLPLGTIVRVLQNHYPAVLVGSLTTLYKGLANLDSVHFEKDGCKEMLLNPRTSSENARHKLKLNLDGTDEPTKYFMCASTECRFKTSPSASNYRGLITCDCKQSTLSKLILFKNSIAQGADDGVSGVFTMRTAHFIISDDLQILPSVTGNVIRFLSNMGITDADDTELMNVTFGFKEIMDLLKGALLSDTPLTDIVLNKGQVKSFDVKYEKGTLVPPDVKNATTNTKVFVAKAILQKSTNKLLYVEGDDKFVEFLFSLLTIPLGRIEYLLGGSTKFKNIDNLYRTLGEIDSYKYFKTQGTKSMLLYPNLPPDYISNSQFIPLTEETSRATLYLHKGDYHWQDDYLSPFSNGSKCSVLVKFTSAKGMGNYVKGPTMFMITDDLVVTPLCTTSSLSILNRLRVPLSDVKELDMKIGLEEGLKILRASLTSTCCLSQGLSNLLFEKQPKQEKRV